MSTVLTKFPEEFVVKWLPLQFEAWRRSKAYVSRNHEDAKKKFDGLPDDVKNFLISLVSHQLQLLLNTGGKFLNDVRLLKTEKDKYQAVSSFMERASGQFSNLEYLAATYHNTWFTLRSVQQTILTTPPAKRDDDVPWSQLTDPYKQECREIILQLLLLIVELSEEDFSTFIQAAAD